MKNMKKITDLACELGFIMTEDYDWSPILCIGAIQTWLRDTHNIHITIYWTSNGWDAGVKETPDKIVNKTEFFDTYEEALECGLSIALEIVKKRNGIPDNKTDENKISS